MLFMCGHIKSQRILRLNAIKNYLSVLGVDTEQRLVKILLDFVNCNEDLKRQSFKRTLLSGQSLQLM